MNNSTVTFKVAGNDVLSFISKVKQQSDELTGKMIADAKKQSDVARDQLKLVEDQIKAIERKNKLEIESARRNAAVNRDASRLKNESEYNADVKAIGLDKTLSSTDKREAIKGASELRSHLDTAADSTAKDQLKAIRDQEKQSQLLGKYMRDNIETVKTTSNAEVIQMKKGDDSLIKELDDNAQPVDKLAREIALEKYEDGKKPKPAEDEPKTRQETMFSAFIKAMALERVYGMAAGMPNAKNELDFVKPLTSMIGMAIGGLMGNGLDSLEGIKVLGTGAGQTNFAALGIQLGEKAGEMIGGALERSYKGRDELTTSNFRLQALTGRDMQVDAFAHLGGTGMSKTMTDLTKYGEDFKATSELQYKIATAKGTGGNLGKDSENVMALQQALGVSQETSTSLMELMRSSKADGRDVMKLVSGILQSGSGKGGVFAGDRTFLSEFLTRNFISLQKTLLQTSEHVGSATTMDILQRFNSVGGMFASRDPRSMGLINQINGSLVNPGSDSMKAYSYLALRRMHPNMDYADIDVEREKGLGSPDYLKAMLGTIDSLGGDEQFKRKNISGAFGIGAAAAKELYENRKKLMDGTLKLGDLQGGTGALSEQGVRTTGEAQTSLYTKSTAEIQNEFIKSAVGGLQVVGKKMETLFGDMVDQTAKYVNDKFESLIHGGKSAAVPVQKNMTKSGKKGKVGEDFAPSSFGGN